MIRTFDMTVRKQSVWTSRRSCATEPDAGLPVSGGYSGGPRAAVL